MNIEYEGRILEINKDELIEKLENLGAKKEGDFFQKRYVYDFNPIKKGKWIRLRTNGKQTTLTIKSVEELTISGTKEIEITVDDFDKTNMILNELGYNYRSYQENKRTRYILNEVEIDIDSWPMIPTYVEVEGKNEDEVIKTIKLLGYSKEDICTLDVQSIYEYYNKNIDEYRELKFEEE